MLNWRAALFNWTPSGLDKALFFHQLTSAVIFAQCGKIALKILPVSMEIYSAAVFSFHKAAFQMTSCFCDRVEKKCFHNVKACKNPFDWSLSIWTCSFVCKGCQTTTIRVVFPHHNHTDDKFWFWATDWFCSILAFGLRMFVTTQSKNVFCLTHNSAAPSSLWFFTLHPLLSVSEFTFVAKVWPLQHRLASQWGVLIQTFQPKCFNSNEGKKRGKNKKAKAKQASQQSYILKQPFIWQIWRSWHT